MSSFKTVMKNFPAGEPPSPQLIFHSRGSIPRKISKCVIRN